MVGSHPNSQSAQQPVAAGRTVTRQPRGRDCAQGKGPLSPRFPVDDFTKATLATPAMHTHCTSQGWGPTVTVQGRGGESN